MPQQSGTFVQMSPQHCHNITPYHSNIKVILKLFQSHFAAMLKQFCKVLQQWHDLPSSPCSTSSGLAFEDGKFWYLALVIPICV